MNGSTVDEPSFAYQPSHDLDRTPCAYNNSDSDISVPPPRIYKRRWYILFGFSMMCMCFGLATSVLGPIANALKQAYSWNNAEIALLSTWSPLTLVLTSTFFSWLLDTKGLRTSFLCSTSFLALGSGVRCLPAISSSFNWCLHAGTMIIGLASTLAYAGCTTVSNNWFPPHQRILATSLAAGGLVLGGGAGSLASPFLVPVQTNITNSSSITFPISLATFSIGIHADDVGELTKLRSDIVLLQYIVFGIATLIWVASIIYFPSKPPTAPSVSASSERLDFYGGFKAIIKKPKFWIITAMLALSSGISAGLCSVLDVNLEAAHLPGDEMVSGFLLTGALLASLFMSLGVSIFTDRYRKYVKTMLLVLSIIALAGFLWFALILQGFAPANYVSLYISFITAQTAVLSPAPVYLELACDAVYPIAEGITTGFANLPLSLAVVLSMYIFFIPNVGTLWMNWVMVGAAAACIPLLLLFTPSPGRLQVDDSQYTTEDKKLLIPPLNSNDSNQI